MDCILDNINHHSWRDYMDFDKLMQKSAMISPKIEKNKKFGKN